MSIRPRAYNPDGSADIWHGDANHGGPAPLADACRLAARADGSIDEGFVVVTCPVCGLTATHPISGGGYNEQVQLLAARLLMPRRGGNRRAKVGAALGRIRQAIAEQDRDNGVEWFDTDDEADIVSGDGRKPGKKRREPPTPPRRPEKFRTASNGFDVHVLALEDEYTQDCPGGPPPELPDPRSRAATPGRGAR